MMNSSVPALLLHRLVALHSRRIEASRTTRTPIISFTFDDFPRSAAGVAADILAEYGKLATYYVSSSLMGTANGLGDMFRREDLVNLSLAGHELACHTFSHVPCSGLADEELMHNCEENRDCIASLVNGYLVSNFSYPNGVVTLAAKTCLASVYHSNRSSQPGLNLDPIDLGFLRANPVYSRFDIARPKDLIRRNTKESGWLIFYTHDVADSHSRYGCTPEYFREVVRCAVESGAEIEPVGKVVPRFVGTHKQ